MSLVKSNWIISLLGWLREVFDFKNSKDLPWECGGGEIHSLNSKRFCIDRFPPSIHEFGGSPRGSKMSISPRGGIIFWSCWVHFLVFGWEWDDFERILDFQLCNFHGRITRKISSIISEPTQHDPKIHIFILRWIWTTLTPREFVTMTKFIESMITKIIHEIFRVIFP